MKEKIGILAFYLDIERIAPEDVDNFIESIIVRLAPEDETEPLSNWQCLFLPVRNQETRIQVIRNSGSDNSTEELNELKEYLEKIANDAQNWYNRSENLLQDQVCKGTHVQDKANFWRYLYDLFRWK